MKKVIVFGTYDIIHQGHLDFFKQAKKLGGFLTVVVARDKHAFQTKKRSPKNNEKKRVKNVRKIGFVNKAILGSRTHNFYRTIRTYKPDIIALGYDQKPTIWNLRKDLKKHRLRNLEIVRLKAFKPKKFKSSIILKTKNG